MNSITGIVREDLRAPASGPKKIANRSAGCLPVNSRELPSR